MMRPTASRLTFAILATLTLLGACRRQERTSVSASPDARPTVAEREHPSAFVRVVDSLPGDAPIDIFAGDKVVFPHVAYGTVTAYQELPEDRTTFRIRPGGQDTAMPLAEATSGLDGGKRYTVLVLAGKEGKPAALEVLKDVPGDVANDKARLRVVNTSPSLEKAEIVIGGRVKPIVSGIGVNESTDYAEVEPIVGTLEVRSEARKKEVVAKVRECRLEAGRSYTLFVLGQGGIKKTETLLVPDEVPRAAS